MKKAFGALLFSMGLLSAGYAADAPRGWSSDYMVMSSISEGVQNVDNYTALAARYRTFPVQQVSIFTYANGGDDTWTVSVDHERILGDELTKVKKEMEMARQLEQETGKSVMPVLVVYTSGGSASTSAMNIDFGFEMISGANVNNLNIRFFDLIKLCELVQSYQDEQHLYPATFVVNPDFLGEAHKIYRGVSWAPDETIHAINPELAPKVSKGIPLLEAVKYAYVSLNKPLPAALPSFVNNQGSLSDYIQTINWLIKTFAPSVPFGWENAIWAGDTAGHKWIHKGSSELAGHVQQELEFLKQLKIYDINNPYRPDFFAFDKYERDDFDGNPNSLNNGYTYNIPAWNLYMAFITQVGQGLGDIPLMLFQLQGGHLQTFGDADPRGSHGATGASYFFGSPILANNFNNVADYIRDLNFDNPSVDYNVSDPSVRNYLRQFDPVTDPQGWTAGHTELFKKAGVFGILWGGGNTTSIAGNSKELDDAGFLSQQIVECYHAGACKLK